MRDIETRADIELLVKTFYTRLLKLDEMKSIFNLVNFEEHVPNIVHFWSFVLLDEPGYTTNVFEKHRELPIKAHQFDHWLIIFTATVDDLFEGVKAELAKQRATVLAHTFKSKWEKMKKE